MSDVVVALIVFVCVFSGALLGLYVHAMLPEHHLDDDSVGVVKLATGLIATMAALVLGLLISSAKSSFDTVNSELVHNAANIVRLDRVLAQYGPETHEVRDLLKQNYSTWIQILASRDPAQVSAAGSIQSLKRAEGLQHKLKELSPRNEEQRQLQTSAIQIADEALAVRGLALLQEASSLPIPLLVALVLWLSIIFGAFGVFASANGTVIAALFLGALSTSMAICLILEMNSPLAGLIAVSLAPMRNALAMLGQ
ncbi:MULTISPECIES: DUF4239 domain-containing protein [Paraburkholderia]|uniref:DUF4239 domain-containing protein n=1 Tax=Paraburkholderia hospita TaxID=169430 RepID=A0AAJ4VZH3_9BURK|nr:DUF4239 domain-containing protein [Paraburkholderia hospita]AUT69170.1 DUF4239 domain-containing protein [Paraburkholderia hospita]AXE99300.1 DUF4239 domain-containing protein [Paraburkholderia hospita]EIM96409.1 hypothetical protein WQE_33656 [Paraburkholderia hospita]OUL77174.1 hypothetical protein CA602_33175 [Paraburkholderia hospita]OUL95873.1 hypothetical protein CA603_06910 [Paraburkholderia hospita]